MNELFNYSDILRSSKTSSDTCGLVKLKRLQKHINYLVLTDISKLTSAHSNIHTALSSDSTRRKTMTRLITECHQRIMFQV